MVPARKNAGSSEDTIHFSVLDEFRPRTVNPPKEITQDSWGSRYLIIAAILCLAAIPYFADEIGFLCALLHAHAGDADSQHMVAQHFLQGVGITQNKEHASKWFRRASDNGDHRAGYNLALSHVHRTHESLQPGEAEVLIKRAADAGLEEAIYALEYTCAGGKCRR
ncbi:uncharacterized protein LOC129591892 [Paramacrobiotus metropolitanus]|uniref:uncharacterized protein LOC129591892 n=1 Tax=Paramacrobiotus metropolitanus TaxID=2943436 RepID=UPI0024464439|nr:uncharacterized protein LOC129591892 [Paramacrobiotus metropolitanus]